MPTTDARAIPLRLGRWILDRRLELAPLGECWLARHVDCYEPVAAYRLDNLTTENFAIDELASIELPHVQHVVAFERDEDGQPWVIAEYTGHHAGVVRLPAVLGERDHGRLSPNEALQATLQLLEAFAAGEDLGIGHTPPEPDEILIDRLGKVRVELFGLRPAAHGSTDPSEVAAQVARIAYRMLTGIEVGDGAISASRLVKQTPRHFDRWLRVALDPIDGFQNAGEAFAALRDDAPTHEIETGVRPVSLVKRAVRRGVARR